MPTTCARARANFCTYKSSSWGISPSPWYRLISAQKSKLIQRASAHTSLQQVDLLTKAVLALECHRHLLINGLHGGPQQVHQTLEHMSLSEKRQLMRRKHGK